MSNNPATKYLATGVAAVVLTFGAFMIGKSNTGSTAAGTNAAAQAQPGAAPSSSGQIPQGGQLPPGMGSDVTGAVATKVAAAATAKYPGTVERVVRLTDGSYVAHVLLSGGGERHVLVSNAFNVTGSQQGGPGAGGPPGSSQQQPGAPSASGSQS